MIHEFTGKKVFVTDAAQGIGRSIVKAFLEAGAFVHLCDIDAEGLKTTALECDATRIHTHCIDATSQVEVSKCIETIGGIDIFVHSAGGVCGQVGRPLTDVSEADWHKIFSINADSAFWFSQAVVPYMKAQQFGRLIFISSGAGLGVSLTGIQAYAASKAAQIGLTRQLAHELGEFGITVNNVAPGFIRSNPSTEKQWHAFGEARQQQILQNIACRTLGQPEDIAQAVLFFASNEAKWITGQVLSVDGGK